MSQVRGVTRHPEKEAAKQLASTGVEVVQADELDPPSVLKAMQGSYAVSSGWQHSVPHRQSSAALHMPKLSTALHTMSIW